MVNKRSYVRIVPKYRKPLIERITESIELDIRDLKIKTIWEYMKNFVDMSYSNRIAYLSKEFSLSKKTIEKIISDGKELV